VVLLSKHIEQFVSYVFEISKTEDRSNELSFSIHFYSLAETVKCPFSWAGKLYSNFYTSIISRYAWYRLQAIAIIMTIDAITLKTMTIVIDDGAVLLTPPQSWRELCEKSLAFSLEQQVIWQLFQEFMVLLSLSVQD
jgi:hypothetical protein